MTNLKKLTKADEESLEDRLLMALYYAYGHNDAVAGAGPYVPPEAFATFHRDQYRDVLTGATSFCPSVQDAFGYYLTTVAS